MTLDNINQSKPNFTHAWIMVGFMCFSQLVYILLCHYLPDFLQQAALVMAISEEQRVLVRTIFYVIAIITFPLTNLIRHIQLRLNQTVASDKPLNKRYLLTVIVSQSIISVIGVFGLVMFFLGDGFNTLYIFSALAFLGFFLHRPKEHEYQSIMAHHND